MGRIILVILVLVTLYLLWKAFGPGNAAMNARTQQPQRPAIKGPDDDEEFLWKLQKEAYKRKQAERQRQERQQQKPPQDPQQPQDPNTPPQQ